MESKMRKIGKTKKIEFELNNFLGNKKMENKTVKELREIAKAQKLKNYSKMRKD
jgi:hypothetical protein